MSTLQNTHQHPLRHKLFVSVEVLITSFVILTIPVLVVGAFFFHGLFSNVTKLDIKKAPGLTSANSVLEPEKNQTTALQKELDLYAEQLPTEAGIVVHNLKTGEHAEVNGHKPFIAASTYKLFVAHEVLRSIEIDEISFNEPAGNETSKDVRTCLREMIIISSNECGIALARKVGYEKINPQLKSLGFDETDLTRYDMETTADDVFVFYNHLYNGLTLEKDSQQFLLEQLNDQRINDRFSIGLPDGTKFAHKTGNLFGNFHDGGIVYRHGDYIIVMLSGPWNSRSQAQTYFADLASTVDVYFAKN